MRHVKRLWWWWGSGCLLVILGVLLGMWQWERAAEKRAYLQHLSDAPRLESPRELPPEGALVALQGEFLAEHTYYLDNRIIDGQVGVAVLTPLRDIEGRLWLVQRGYVATGGSRTDPAITTPAGQVEIVGQWQPEGATGPLFGPNQEGRRLQQLALIPWEETLGGFAHQGWLHMQQGPGMFTSWWQPNVMPPQRHVGYAIQWWGLALTALMVMLIGGRRLRRDMRESCNTRSMTVRE